MPRRCPETGAFILTLQEAPASTRHFFGICRSISSRSLPRRHGQVRHNLGERRPIAHLPTVPRPDPHLKTHQRARSGHFWCIRSKKDGDRSAYTPKKHRRSWTGRSIHQNQKSWGQVVVYTKSLKKAIDAQVYRYADRPPISQSLVYTGRRLLAYTKSVLATGREQHQNIRPSPNDAHRPTWGCMGPNGIPG